MATVGAECKVRHLRPLLCRGGRDYCHYDDNTSSRRCCSFFYRIWGAVAKEPLLLCIFADGHTTSNTPDLF